ncbi:hypothetical protein [Arthrobacter sp. CJ23]|uniref:hypothetical protein n=1 Tax=Arthrobacter sp. CJ23 TaxID=2972479 RepID=UPI00215D08EE|nr:hypothetical protein [Arthrobacter sp. CJ23]UVJ38040.1 hypothetical protein NVV90_12290 [Arthrobacter sp. CJ23]
MIIVVWSLGLWLTSVAKTQLETQVTLSPARTVDIIEQCFSGLLWKDAPGPGAINKRRRSLSDKTAVISIEIAPLPNGGSHVAVWMSAWQSKYGIANDSGVIGMKKKIIRRLEAA